MHRLRQIGGSARHAIEQLAWTNRHLARRMLVSDVRRGLHALAKPPSPLLAHESSHWSQNGEDGLIGFLAERLGIECGHFVEIGAADGQENCTRQLLEEGWSGVWVEGDPRRAAHAATVSADRDVAVLQSMVTPGNVLELLSRAGLPVRFDLLVVDIDGDDWLVTREILSGHRPRMIVHEYNAEHAYWWRMGRRAGAWRGDWNYGGSLQAFGSLLASAGYALIGTESTGVNAFWVRREDLRAPLRESSASDAWRPGRFLAGPFGHPRRARAAMRDAQPDLDAIELTRLRVIGGAEQDGRRHTWIVGDVRNRGDAPLTSTGPQPVHLACVGAAGYDAAHEPLRAKLPADLDPGRARPAVIECANDHREHRHAVAVVHESVRWADRVFAVER